MRIAAVFLLATATLSAGDLAPLSPFGIGACHINNRSVRDFERWVPQMEAIGLRNHRTPQTHWGSVEPQPGVWQWDVLDAQMDYLSAHGFTFGGTLIGNPSWNEKDARGSLPVNHLTGWSDYVTAIVEHANGRIKRWEVWNEPPNFTGKDQTPADYAKIVVAAYDATKAVDPTCHIGLAAKSAHIHYLEQVIQAGARDHFDFITLHPYEVLNGIADNAGTESVFMHILPTLRKMLAVQNPEKADVPVIFTELGCDVKKGEGTQAQALIKAYTMGIAQGVECIQWFEGRDGDSGPMGLLDREGNPRPSYHAMQRLIEHFGQHPEYLGWCLLNERHYAFAFQGAAAPLLVTWARGGAEDDVDFGSPVTLIDPMSGDRTSADRHRLTHAAVILRNPPSALIESAKANHGKPLTWDGDYSEAKEVFLTMGEADGERGLHTLSGASLASAVTAYGGSARAGNVPGGNLFIVDPEFLSYTTTPIEIEVVVRRNEANDKAGFKLVYESTDGFKTVGGWFNVPDNQQWHTKRWRIDDAQFVNYWGYNFSLVSDGDVLNRYYLKSVTVRKLTE